MFIFLGILAGVINKNAGSLPFLPGLLMFIVIEILDIICVYQFYHIPRVNAKNETALAQDDDFQISKSADGEFAVTKGHSHVTEDSAAYMSTTTTDIPRVTRVSCVV